MSQDNPQAPAKNQRHLRNYLLDAPFQLKYAGFTAAFTVMASGLLGVFIWTMTGVLFTQAQLAVDAQSKVAEISRDLSRCTLNNELLQNMGAPGFAEELAQRFETIDTNYEAQKDLVEEQRRDLITQQKHTLWSLVVALLIFVLGVTMASVVSTHRIVGPLFRLKRMARALAAGEPLDNVGKLRPTDELHETYETFAQMVTALATRRVELAGELEALERRLREGASASDAAATLATLRSRFLHEK